MAYGWRTQPFQISGASGWLDAQGCDAVSKSGCGPNETAPGLCPGPCWLSGSDSGSNGETRELLTYALQSWRNPPNSPRVWLRLGRAVARTSIRPSLGSARTGQVKLATIFCGRFLRVRARMKGPASSTNWI
jgi:hypothetical protein